MSTRTVAVFNNKPENTFFRSACLCIEEIARRQHCLLSLIFLLIFLSSCTRETDNTSVRYESQKYMIRLGAIPDRHSEQLLNQYQPLTDYLESETGIEFRMVTANSYDQLVKMLLGNRIDLVNFGALTYLQAARSGKAFPLVMRNNDLKFTSHFLINASQKAETLADAKDLRLAFGSEYSTSGHLMPRFFMKKRNINPESFFRSVTFSGAHDKTALMVQQGKADIGVANSLVIDKMFKEGDLNPEKLRILWTTPPYVDYVWTVHADMDLEIRDSIMVAFLKLSAANRRHQDILNSLRANYYVPANSRDFDNLENIAVDMGYLDREP